MADAKVAGTLEGARIAKKVEFPTVRPEGTADGEGLPEFPEGLDPFSGPRANQKKPRNPNTDIANAGTPDEPVRTMARGVQDILQDVTTRIPTKPLRVTVETPPEPDEPHKKAAKTYARVDW